MANEENGKPSQQQDSRQSERQGEPKKSSGKPVPGKHQDEAGIGSSQGQDRGSPSEQQAPRPSAGTPDIERGSARDTAQRSSTESLVNDLTGAFKERP